MRFPADDRIRYRLHGHSTVPITHHQSADKADLGGVVDDVQFDNHLVDVGEQLGEADGFEQTNETECRQLKFGNRGHLDWLGHLTLDEVLVCVGQQSGGLAGDGDALVHAP